MPNQLIPRIFLSCVFLFIASGCGEENAAKYAKWLGAKSINESSADHYAKESTAVLSRCVARFRKGEPRDEIQKCFDKASDNHDKAVDLYLKDCNLGNNAACRKVGELMNQWEAILK